MKRKSLKIQSETESQYAPSALSKERISVIMPAFRLAQSIRENVLRVADELSRESLNYEIIPVDDGSNDGSAEILSALASDRIHPVLLQKNRGKGDALRAGFQASGGSLILLLDADLDLAPEMLPRFLKIMQAEDAAIVIGSKRHPESQIDYPWSRRFASAVYYSLVLLLTGLPVTDTQTGMKLFRREALAWAFDRMLVKRYAFDVEVLAIANHAGYKVAEAPIRMEYGAKQGALTFRNIQTVLTDTLAIFYRLRILRYYQNVELATLSDPPPSITVLIACPGPSRYLDEAIAGLSRQSLPATEIIILPDEVFSPPPAWPSTIRILPTGKVRPAEKRNMGIFEAKGDIVAFLDDDASPQPQWLAQAVRHFSRPEIASVGGPAISPTDDPRMAILGGEVYASPLVSGSCRYRYVPERYRMVDDLPSCNLLVRTSILRKIGGYNTRYWPGEDTILCLDIVRAGGKILYDPFATVAHHRRPLFGPHLRQIGRYAMHRGFFARIFPQTSRRLSYMIPSFFVLGIVMGAPLAIISPLLRNCYLGVLGFYGAITLIASFKRKLSDWLCIWIGIMLTHIWYGIRFLQGLFFGKMPKEVRSFDHGPTSANNSPF